MTVLECGDATDIESVLDIVYDIDGPVYVRMLRGEIPRLFSEPMQFCKARLLSEGDDIALLSSGICTEEAIRAVKVLKEHDVSIQHLHITTLKPFDDPEVFKAITSAKHGVITMENHTVIGGLGTAVSEVMAENGIQKRLLKIGIQDTYMHGASRNYLMKEYGLDSWTLVKKCEKLLLRKLKIKEEDLVLPSSKTSEISKELKPEDL